MFDIAQLKSKNRMSSVSLAWPWVVKMRTRYYTVGLLSYELNKTSLPVLRVPDIFSLDLAFACPTHDWNRACRKSIGPLLAQ